MKSGQFLLLMLMCVDAFSQSKPPAVSTAQGCNASAEGINIKVEVKCGSDGLSHEEAQNLADQYRDLTGKVGKGNIAIAVLSAKLNTLIKEIEQNRVSTTNEATSRFGIANAGGTVINSPVTTMFGTPRPPPPIAVVQGKPTSQSLSPMLMGLERGRIEQFTVTVGDDFVQPAFIVTCERPCKFLGVLPQLSDSHGETKNYPTSDPNSNIVWISEPRVLPKGTKVQLEVVADDNKPLIDIKIATFAIP